MLPKSEHKNKIRLNKPLLIYITPIIIIIGLLFIVAPGYMLFLLVLALGGYLIFFKPSNWTMLLVLGIVLSSCSQDYYWSAYSTSHGEKAQQQYIKNQKKHKAEKRFYTSDGPTFGAHAVGKKKNK